MPATVSIQLELQDNGTIKGLRAIGSELNSVGKSGNQAGTDESIRPL
jgi:hypothetical protein